MRVGWAIADYNPGSQIGSDEASWAYDGYNVSFFFNFIKIINCLYIVFKIIFKMKH